MEIVNESIYDHPRYYDLVFGSDCAAEIRFIHQINDQFLGGKAKQFFEPACGTCRLIHLLAKKGTAVEGIDLNEKAVQYGNQRFARHGLPETAWVADMSDFKPRRKFDLAFNTINSFRHLLKPAEAAGHLTCMANGAKSKGIYLIGLHLNPSVGEMVDGESWSARRGHLSVLLTSSSSGWWNWRAAGKLRVRLILAIGSSIRSKSTKPLKTSFSCCERSRLLNVSLKTISLKTRPQQSRSQRA